MGEVDIYKQAEVAIQNAHGIFLDHQLRLSKASTVTKGLLEHIEKNGMSDDSYKNAAELLKRLNITVKTFTEERKMVTQAAQAIVKAFTSQENALDVSKPETDAYRLKKLMDDYATKKEMERRRKEEEERVRVEKEREISSVQISAMSFLESVCNKAMSEIKSGITALANSISLENYEEIRAKMLAYDTRIPEGLFGNFDVEIKTVYIGKDEKKRIIADLMELDDWQEMQDNYGKEMGIFLQETLATLPSIRKELEAIAAADFDRAEEMKKEKMLREFEEKERIEKERQIAEEALEQERQEKIRKANMQTEFEFGASIAELDSGVKSKNGYEIILTMPMGLLEVTQFWCQKQVWPMDEKKVMTVSFERMVKFAENEAAKNQNFIKSDYVVYKPIVQSKL